MGCRIKKKEKGLLHHVFPRSNMYQQGTMLINNQWWEENRSLRVRSPPTNKNYAVELPTFGVIIGFSLIDVQWCSLILEESASWSRLTSLPGKYALFISEIEETVQPKCFILGLLPLDNSPEKIPGKNDQLLAVPKRLPMCNIYYWRWWHYLDDTPEKCPPSNPHSITLHYRSSLQPLRKLMTPLRITLRLYMQSSTIQAAMIPPPESFSCSDVQLYLINGVWFGSRFQTGNLSITLQKWSCEVWPWSQLHNKMETIL